jgi:hypothetical protein
MQSIIQRVWVHQPSFVLLVDKVFPAGRHLGQRN